MAALLAVLAAAFYLTSRPKPSAPAKPTTYAWSVDMTSLERIVISLPKEGKREAWVKHSDQYWYFDRSNGPRVDMNRWGGGIPLLLSGPEVKRTIARDASNAKLSEYGLLDPQMKIGVTLDSGKTIDVDVGKSTPDGKSYYLKLAGSRSVYTVDYSWYKVLERLVLDPPYPVGSHRKA